MQGKLRGSCLCGGVEYEIRSPFEFFQYCHCNRCRKVSGSAHAANLLLSGKQFAWIKGEAPARRWELPGAMRFCTGFCSVCGSRLPAATRDG